MCRGGWEEVPAPCCSRTRGLILCATDPPCDLGIKVRACFVGIVVPFQRWEWGAQRGSSTFPGSPKGTGSSRMRLPTPGVYPHSLTHTSPPGVPAQDRTHAACASHPQCPARASCERALPGTLGTDFPPQLTPVLLSQVTPPLSHCCIKLATSPTPHPRSFWNSMLSPGPNPGCGEPGPWVAVWSTLSWQSESSLHANGAHPEPHLPTAPVHSWRGHRHGADSRAPTCAHCPSTRWLWGLGG